MRIQAVGSWIDLSAMPQNEDPGGRLVDRFDCNSLKIQAVGSCIDVIIIPQNQDPSGGLMEHCDWNKTNATVQILTWYPPGNHAPCSQRASHSTRTEYTRMAPLRPMPMRAPRIQGFSSTTAHACLLQLHPSLHADKAYSPEPKCDRFRKGNRDKGGRLMRIIVTRLHQSPTRKTSITVRLHDMDTCDK